MEITLVNELKQEAEKLLNDYRKFGATISPYNFFDRMDFSEKQPKFEAAARILINKFNNLDLNQIEKVEKSSYEDLRELISDIKEEIF